VKQISAPPPGQGAVELQLFVHVKEVSSHVPGDTQSWSVSHPGEHTWLKLQIVPRPH
jgi:hypothetical protein